MSASQPAQTAPPPRSPGVPLRILAVIIGIAPVYSLVIWMHLTLGRNYTAWEMILYPLTFGVGTIVLICLLHSLLLREKLATLNSGKGNVWLDIAGGVGLAVGLIALAVIEQMTIYRWLPFTGGGQFDSLLMGMLENPLLLILWFGPVVWIGIAIFEEIMRVFILHHLWRVWPGALGAGTVILLAAIVFAFGHLYQGPAGMASNFISAVVKGLIYLKFRRFWVLVIAHALYDTAWIVFGMLQMQRMAGGS